MGKLHAHSFPMRQWGILMLIFHLIVDLATLESLHPAASHRESTLWHSALQGCICGKLSSANMRKLGHSCHHVACSARRHGSSCKRRAPRRRASALFARPWNGCCFSMVPPSGAGTSTSAQSSPPSPVEPHFCRKYFSDALPQLSHPALTHTPHHCMPCPPAASS